VRSALVIIMGLSGLCKEYGVDACVEGIESERGRFSDIDAGSALFCCCMTFCSARRACLRPIRVFIARLIWRDMSVLCMMTAILNYLLTFLVMSELTKKIYSRKCWEKKIKFSENGVLIRCSCNPGCCLDRRPLTKNL
jgi:hypothetical protein